MKKTTQTTLSLMITLMLCLSQSADVAAQIMERHSLNFYFGLGATNIAKSYVKSLSPEKTTQLPASGRGPLSFTCQYAASRKLAIGLQAGFQSGLSAPLTWNQPNNLGGTDARRYTMSMKLYTLLVKTDFHYTRGRIIDVYSGFSVGYGVAHVTYTGVEDPDAITDFGNLKGFAYSVNAIGFRMMLPRNIGVFAEFGYGIMGLANFGVSMKTRG